ncbi:MAG: tetratricopeptide repeat protein [Alphaproteobacteria bacterium]|nr:tetratricopeptide repeat protein [Alphaproteobacteria bacterium]
MKSLAILLAACTIGACVDNDFKAAPGFQQASLETSAGSSAEKLPPVHAGDYLSSLFAQSHHDWKNAEGFIGNIMAAGIEDPLIRRRAMILAMGSGDASTAIQLAQHSVPDDPNKTYSDDDTIALIFMVMGAFDQKDYKQAELYAQKMPKDGMSQFIGPFLTGWSNAALGKMEISGLKNNAIHLYHAILISDYLKQYGDIEKLLTQAEVVQDISTEDLERIADIYAHINKPKKALELYSKIQKDWPDDAEIKEKISQIQSGKVVPLFKSIKTPQEGLGEAFYDISKILFDEYSDESARVFGFMALHLDPNLTDAKLLLAHIAARHERYDEAIAHYRAVPENSPEYLDTQRKIAEIMVKQENDQDALKILSSLATKKDDVASMIEIGDIYRKQENYGAAIDAYKKAAKTFGGEIPASYWHLYYVLGMSYERAGQWDNAEQALKAALKLQPDHPYVLNYLGYAWADRGMNLKEALHMIRKAVSLRPDDGYITDSLGWVMFKMEQYDDAVPELEKAVELLPYDPTINDHLGDAYWKVGRKLEARFQWERAKNYTDDSAFAQVLAGKLVSGLKAPSAVVGSNTTE